MSSGDRCRECGTAIPADSPGGFCGQCLLGLGLSAKCGVRSAALGGELSPDYSARSVQPEMPSAESRLAGVTAALTEEPGDRIGRYRLLEEIGHGGCGVVYMAEQEM